MPATASAMSSRDSGSGDTSRTFTAGILPTSACVLVRATARGRGGRGYHGRTVPDAGDRPMTTPTYLDHASATPLSEPAREIGHRIVASSIEHPAVGGVLHTLETDGFESVLVPVGGDGQVDLDVFASEVRKPGTLLASIQHANHETGTLQPVAEGAPPH